MDWGRRDEEYLVRTQNVVAEMQGQPGRPVWLCYSSIANRAGIGNRIYHLREKLPKTKQFLDSVIEEKDEWRRRKIDWAIRKLLADRKKLSYDSVSRTSGVSSSISPGFREYIEAELKKSKYT